MRWNNGDYIDNEKDDTDEDEDDEEEDLFINNQDFQIQEIQNNM